MDTTPKNESVTSSSSSGRGFQDSIDLPNTISDIRGDSDISSTPSPSPSQARARAYPRSRVNAATNTDPTEDSATSDDEDPSIAEEIGTSTVVRDSTIGEVFCEKVHCVALPLLKQRLGYLWEKKMFTDVVFIVGRDETKIEAHRIILASASEVFQNLLFLGGKPVLSDEGKHVLYESDFSEQAVEVFIKAMYTNEIPICLTLPMALEVFYATKKYAVVFLEDQILEHIRQLLTVSNVFEALRLSTNAIELTYLAPICWKIIEEQTSAVLEYHQEDLDPHLFARVLERDQLNMGEVELFQIAVRWAANLCKTNGLKTTGRNKRQFMEPLVKNFRFTTMTPAQFTDAVIPSRILEPKEIQQIKYVFNKGTDSRILSQLPYKTTPRVITTCCQEQVSEEKSSTLKHSERWALSNRSSRDEVTKICSDSAVIAPNGGSKLYLKRGTISSRAKSKRVATRTKS